jgi:hypothetical protein
VKRPGLCRALREAHNRIALRPLVALREVR